MRERLQVNVNGLTLSYVVDGPEDAPTVLLVHGHGASAEDWFDVMDGLKPDHRVYAMTMRGHQGSAWAAEYSLDLFASDIIGFAEALGLERVTLVGHSMGGIASVLAAQRRPSWLSRLVLEEAPVPYPGWFTRDMPQRPDDPGNDWDNIAPMLNDSLVNPEPQWWEDLPDIEVPTLGIGGGQLSAFPQRNIVGLGDRIRGFRAETIEVGHLVHADAPDRFLAVLRNFLGT